MFGKLSCWLEWGFFLKRGLGWQDFWSLEF